MTTRPYVVGIDGEGIGRAPHRYTLLAWSDASGKRSAHIEDSRGLSTLACLGFVAAVPLAARVYGYYLGYDWTKILGDLPNRDIYRLMRPELRVLQGEGGGFSEVPFKHFRLHYLAGMMRVKDLRSRRSVTVWDVGKFYQDSFCKLVCDRKHKHEKSCFSGALPKWSVGSVELWTRIATMKNKRSTFSVTERKRIREYCLEECAALAELVQQLNDAHASVGLPLRKWYGPGSSAKVALGQLGIKTKRGEHPPEVLRAADAAFFGGRFENRAIGTFEGLVYGYDLISAYPAATRSLPCLEHARWRRTTRERDLSSQRLGLVRFALGPTTRQAWWGPLPIRLAQGSIVFPRSGATGWTYAAEFRAARELAPNVRFLEAWLLSSSCNCRPFERVEEWFAERLRIGKSGRGIVLKLVLNSLYGCLAQTLGIAPPFACRLWAGMITSAVRAELLRAIALDPEGVLCTATDGIYSQRPLALDVGSALGQWEAKRVERITLVRPGIYWTEESVRARGIGRGALPLEQREAILAALDAGEPKVQLPPVTRFGGAKASVYRAGETFRRSERYGEWSEQPCRISFDPAPKRGPGFALFDLPDVESVPYSARTLSIEALQLMRAEELAMGGELCAP